MSVANQPTNPAVGPIAPQPVKEKDFEPVLLINIRNPDVRIAKTMDVDHPRIKGKTVKAVTNEYIRFVNTQYLAQTKEDYDIVKSAQPWVFEEPSDTSLHLFEDKTYGFKTRNAECYDAWMNSEARASKAVKV